MLDFFSGGGGRGWVQPSVHMPYIKIKDLHILSSSFQFVSSSTKFQLVGFFASVRSVRSNLSLFPSELLVLCCKLVFCSIVIVQIRLSYCHTLRIAEAGRIS